MLKKNEKLPKIIKSNSLIKMTLFYAKYVRLRQRSSLVISIIFRTFSFFILKNQPRPFKREKAL